MSLTKDAKAHDAKREQGVSANGQFDLVNAYRLLIGAYIRSIGKSEQTSREPKKGHETKQS